MTAIQIVALIGRFCLFVRFLRWPDQVR